MAVDQIVRRIVDAAPGLHSACPLPHKTLLALASRLAENPPRLSAETGCGASTLLLSHFSRKHLVFADDQGSGSVHNTLASPLLRSERVQFIDGPTQLTLPRYCVFEKRLEGELDFVLLDGPHAFPFPDLEYFYLYPRLATGALLVLDDIHIPSVGQLFDFLRRDEMFELERVVHVTAFLHRTDAPAFNPYGDGWERQRFNQRNFYLRRWRDEWRRFVPPGVARLWRQARGALGSASLRIDAPREGSVVKQTGEVAGTVSRSAGGDCWLLVRRADQDGWWPQGSGPLKTESGRWAAQARFGEPHDAGHEFEILATSVATETSLRWQEWLASPTGHTSLPPRSFRYGEAYRRVRRA